MNIIYHVSASDIWHPLAGYWVRSTTSPVRLGPYRSREHACRDLEAMAPRLIELEGPGAADILPEVPYSCK